MVEIKKLKVSDLIRFLRVEVETLPLILGCLLFQTLAPLYSTNFLGTPYLYEFTISTPEISRINLGLGQNVTLRGPQILV